MAEIGLQPPDRHQDLPRHAEFRLDARQQRRVPLQHRPPGIDAARPDPRGDILLEGLVEGVALAAVEIQHRRVLGDAGEGGAGHALRNAGSLRLGRHAGHEAVEVAAAAGGEGRGGEGDGNEKNGRTKLAHANPLLLPGLDDAMKKRRTLDRFGLLTARRN